VVVADTPQAAQRQPERSAFDRQTGATGLFRTGGQQPPQPLAAPQDAGTRRVPQWIFLTHFWNDIILGDRDALSTSSASVKTSGLRRVLFATAAGLCLLYSIALIVSFARNHALESRVLEAARATATIPASSQDTPSLDSLKRLDALRQELATLGEWEREGAPWSFRWGLYTGSELYPDVYRLYFARFHSMMFGGTQAGILEALRRLPATPSPTDEYAPPYNGLKAYLITTSEWKRSTRAFLSPYLNGRWAAGKNLDPERSQLAQKQFDFYSEELRLKNPYSSENDAGSVEGARRYLKQFNADARIYQALLEEASRRTPSVNYDRLFPNAAVNDPREVRGAFTKDGWAFMQTAFRNPDKIFGGEDWVLGPQTFANLDRSQLEQRLRAFYYADFIKEWREFLKSAAVARYASIPDAAQKLGLISANQSPLLALFCLVSQHTSVDEPTVKLAFQAPQQVVPAACQSQYVVGSNQGYMQNLLGLQAAVQQVAGGSAGANDPAAAQTRQLAGQALLATGQIAQTFAIDKEGNVPAMVKKLMEDPITQVDRLLAGMGPAELRAKGQALCGQFNALMAKYPFNLKSSVQASIDDVNRFFRPPDGALAQFYAQSLQNIVQKDGARYVPKPGSVMNVTPGFLAFYNRAAAFADAAFPTGAQQPRINFALRSDLTGSTQSIQVTLDGQSFTNTAGKSAASKFTWPGTPPGATMQVKFGAEAFNWPHYDGTWASFDFFGDSDERGQPTPGVYRLEWTLRTGQSGRTVTTGTGQPVVVRFDLDMLGAPPVFRKGYFSGWGCVADVAR
jgi:type VI secretion system protein ImpL